MAFLGVSGMSFYSMALAERLDVEESECLFALEELQSRDLAWCRCAVSDAEVGGVAVCVIGGIAGG